MARYMRGAILSVGTQSAADLSRAVRRGSDARRWDAQKHPHGKAMLDVWAQYAPNLNDSVLDSFVQSPLDTERTFPNMRQGDLLAGGFTNCQVGYNRPFRGAGFRAGFCLRPGPTS
jgi:phytoene dehydrogenase-like protein